MVTGTLLLVLFKDLFYNFYIIWERKAPQIVANSYYVIQILIA